MCKRCYQLQTLTFCLNRYYKFYRLLAVYKLLAEVRDTPGSARRWIPNIMLASVAVYMLNAVIYRPSELRAEQALSRAAAYWYEPAVDPEEDDNTGYEADEDRMEPCLDARGVYFVADIVKDRAHGHYRLPVGRNISAMDLTYLYGQTGGLPAVLQAVSGRSLGLSVLSRSNRDRTNNKQPTVEVSLLQDPPMQDFALAERGIVRKRPMEMSGDDVDNLGDVETEPEPSLDEVFTNIWAQFPSDIVQCAPNIRSRLAPSRITLSHTERQAANLEVFQSVTALPFESAYVRVLNKQQWRTLMFPRYFPPKGTPVNPKLQNFRNAQYFRDYAAAMGELQEKPAATVRQIFLNAFEDLSWTPHASTDRMWDTSTRTGGGWLAFPPGHTGPAVNIAVNRERLHSMMDIALYNPEVLDSQIRSDIEVQADEDAAWVAQQGCATHRESVAPTQDFAPSRSPSRRFSSVTSTTFAAPVAPTPPQPTRQATLPPQASTRSLSSLSSRSNMAPPPPRVPTAPQPPAMYQSDEDDDHDDSVAVAEFEAGEAQGRKRKSATPHEHPNQADAMAEFEAWQAAGRKRRREEADLAILLTGPSRPERVLAPADWDTLHEDAWNAAADYIDGLHKLAAEAYDPEDFIDAGATAEPAPERDAPQVEFASAAAASHMAQAEEEEETEEEAAAQALAVAQAEAIRNLREEEEDDEESMEVAREGCEHLSTQRAGPGSDTYMDVDLDTPRPSTPADLIQPDTRDYYSMHAFDRPYTPKRRFRLKANPLTPCPTRAYTSKRSQPPPTFPDLTSLEYADHIP